MGQIWGGAKYAFRAAYTNSLGQPDILGTKSLSLLSSAVSGGIGAGINYLYPDATTPAIQRYIARHNAANPVLGRITTHAEMNAVRAFAAETILTAGAGRAGSLVSRIGPAADRVAIGAARADQLRWNYAADEWGMTKLSAGDRVFGGLPGQSAYYTDAGTLAASGGSRTSLFESLQVNAHPEFGYRPIMGEYEVLGDMRVPFGTAHANPNFGAGGGSQYFIENYSNGLRLVREHPLGQ